MVDTSILIDYFRKTEKSNSIEPQISFWEEVLIQTKVLPFDKYVVKVAVEINNNLKRKRKQIGIADIFIGATAINYRLPIATLNRKYFDRIDGLHVLEQTVANP